MGYFKDIYDAVRTISAGLKVTLPYFFARGVVVQYPDVEPALQPRFRGFHVYRIEQCIACEACSKICPVDCIAVAKTGPRKMDKARNIAVGGAVTEYTINHGTCLFCALCVDVCPTGCLQMGAIHDNSCYRRDDLITNYVLLAKAGRRTVEPIWLMKEKLPAWAVKVRDFWKDLDSDKRELMAHASDPEYCRELVQKDASVSENEK